MIDRPGEGAHCPTNPAREAGFDLLFVLGTLFAVKSALLQVDALWTYAGPISVLASLAVATLCLRRNQESWSDLGLARPASLSKMLGWSLAVLVVTTAAGAAIEVAITSAGIGGSGDVDPRYGGRFEALPGNTGLYLYWVAVSWVVGAFSEEMLFRGMLLSRFERIFSRSAWRVRFAVVLQSILFAQQHLYYQGWQGALATGGIALISGGLYIWLKRSLWPLILSHGLANTVGMTLIYAGVQQIG